MSGPSSVVPHWASVLATERKDKKKAFRKVFVYKDENFPNPTTVTLTNSSAVFSGPVAMLCAKYRNFINYASGLAVIQTTRVNAKKDKEVFECIAVLDLDGFLACFSEGDSFSDALQQKAQELTQEWWGDNGGKDKMSLRVPVERSYKLSQYTWKNKKRQEFSAYDLQLSKKLSRRQSLVVGKTFLRVPGTWGFTQKNLHCETPPRIAVSDVRVKRDFKNLACAIFWNFVFAQAIVKMRTTATVSEIADTSGLIESCYKYDSYGYSVPALHFFGLLKAPGFKRLVEEGKKHRRSEPLRATAASSDAKGGRKRKAGGSAEAAGKKSLSSGGAPSALQLVSSGADAGAGEEDEDDEEEDAVVVGGAEEGE